MSRRSKRRMRNRKLARLARKIDLVLDFRVKEIDLGDGHVYLEMKCPKCRVPIQINEKQRLGQISVHHDIKDGGCGFHRYVRGSFRKHIFDSKPGTELVRIAK